MKQLGLQRDKTGLAEQITYKTNLRNIDWQEMKSILGADQFDNGRNPDQLRESFANSYATAIAYHEKKIVGTARVLSDGICNAYIVDVWTYTPFRRRGIASKMMQILLARVPGQHVYLFTDEAVEFYESLGFKPHSTGMGQVVGKWLQGKTADS